MTAYDAMTYDTYMDNSSNDDDSSENSNSGGGGGNVKVCSSNENSDAENIVNHSGMSR